MRGSMGAGWKRGFVYRASRLPYQYLPTLRESPEALAYLEARGLADADAIDRFQLGFANRTLGLRLPPKTRTAGEEVRSRLQALGILRPSGHEHFNGSVVLPVTDADGTIVEMYGRKIRPDLRPGTPLHLYLPGPHRGVWNAEGLVGATEVIRARRCSTRSRFGCMGCAT